MAKLKLMVTILDFSYQDVLKDIYDKFNINLNMTIQAKGTASSSLLNYFGLSETKKVVNLAIIPDYLELEVLKEVDKSLNIKHPGTGIVFSISLSGANKFLLDGYDISKENVNMNERRYHLIITIVLEGHLDKVMSAAKRVGAQGGTVIRGRGLGNKEATKLFGFEIEPGRDLVLNVVEDNIKTKVMEEITKDVGIKTPCKGICLSIPVDNAIGINFNN